jgi:uncharacterized membrane protein
LPWSALLLALARSGLQNFSEKVRSLQHNQARHYLLTMEISQKELERLLQQVRDLTTRVHDLEQVVGIAKTAPRSERTSATAIPEQSIAAIPKELPVIPRQSPIQPSLPSAANTPSASWASNTHSSDLENRIGSHWLNRIGIAAVLVGVSFFLKYAFENNWIGPAGRVVIGLIAGIAVVLWSERFRRRGYDIFSYSLKAVGIGVLYLSLWASFQVYHLLPSGIVFVGMVVITAITSALAVVQDAEVLAIFAIAGGFATPLLLSTGENREIILFSYLTLLDLAILTVTAAKPWRRIAALGFAGTLILYISWYAEFYDRAQLTPTLMFAGLFFAIFAAVPFFLLRRGASSNLAMVLAFANGVTYFLQAYVMLYKISADEMAWFSLLLATIYLLLARVRLGADETAENNLLLMHLALAIGLITVAVPIRLEAHAITIGWFVESAALLWVGGRLKSDLLNVFAITALALGVARLLVVDNFEPAQLIFNTRLSIYAVAVAVLAFAAYQCMRRGDENWRTVGAIAIIALNVLALRGLSLEVADYYSKQMPLSPRNVWYPEALLQRRAVVIARDFTYSALWMVYGAMLMVIGFWRASAFVRWLALALIALTTAKVFVYDTSQLDRIYRILSFVVLGVLLLAISFAYQRNWLKLPSGKAA